MKAGMKPGAKAFVRAGLALWAITTTLICSSLLARHLLPLPAPRASHLAPGLAALRVRADRPLVFHVLFARCRCSRRVLDSLVATARPPGVEEHVVLIDDADGAMRASLAPRAFTLHDVTAAELAPRLGIDSAPLLIVAMADGRVRYSGGYTDRKQGLMVRDRAIIDAALRGVPPDSLPVYGCPVSERLRAERNPLAIF